MHRSHELSTSSSKWRETLHRVHEGIAGFCMAASREVIAKSDFVLTPGRHCSSVAIDVEGEPFPLKFGRLRAQLTEHFEESATLQTEIERNIIGMRG